jgi:hypothetical protein
MLSNASRARTRSLRRLRAFATEANPGHFAALPQKTDPALLPPYSKLLKKLSVVRSCLNRPLSLAEKILVHCYACQLGSADAYCVSIRT